jgi:hypothetical protein
MVDIETLSRLLYEQCTRSAPTWDQAGDVTKEEWRAMARRHVAGDPRWWSCMPQQAAEPQQELF